MRRSGITAALLIVMVVLLAPAAGAWSSPTTSTTVPPAVSDDPPEPADETSPSTDDTPPSTADTTPSTPSTTPPTTPDTPTPEVEAQPVPDTEPETAADDEPLDDREAWLAGDADDVGATAGTYTVTPSTGLTYSEDVTIAGSGYSSGSLIGAIQCVAGATDFDDCDFNGLRLTNADGSGAFSMPMTLRRFVQVNGGTTDCATASGTCVVGVAPSFAEALLNTTPLEFDPSAPIPPDPVISASPDSNLGLEVTVTITGSGFDPDSFVSILQCVAGATLFEDCSQFGGAFAMADSAGEISTELLVRRGIRTQLDPTVDCADPPGCELVSFMSTDPFRHGRTALAFDPSVPLPPPPDIVVTPSTGLADRQFVTVTASGFDPGEGVYSGQCAAGTISLATCGSVRFLQADSSGSIAYGLRVRRVIGFPPTDCQIAPGECIVFAASFEDVFATANVPLEFDPNAPPVPPPTLTVVPATGLHDGEVVTVTGSGFTPGEQVAMLQCRGGPADETGGNCDIPGTLKYLSVDESGDLHATFTVKRLLRTRNFGDVDCVTDPNGCYLGWGGFSDLQFERGNVPIAFAPDIPVIVSSGGLPATGAGSKLLALLGGGLCLLGALFLLAVRTRARPAIEWHPELDTPL